MDDTLFRGGIASSIAVALGSLILLLALIYWSTRNRGPRRPVDLDRHREALQNFRLRYAAEPTPKRWWTRH
ncbi:hypothetical protein ACFQS7_05370 [Dankookia sp. GCM10030260]|uniref:hypothetical protein n=1 Tax=Dankookia sp. GCM10030260 TaxID=3273390 RepID=UPI0036118C4C